MSDMVGTTMMMVFVILMIPLTGIFLAITPYLMRKGEVFAVTVSDEAADDPYFATLKRRYAVLVTVATVVLTLVALLFLALNNELGALISMIVGLLLICVGSYALMLYFRKEVNLYKATKHWKTHYQESTAVVGESDIPRPVSLKWNLLYIPIFILTGIIGYLGYDSMPLQIPMQMGFDGQVSRWVEKSYWIIFAPVLIEMFFAVCFVLAHWGILRSKRTTDPSTPATSALAYGMFAHAHSLYLVVGGLLMTACMIAMPLTFMNVIGIMQAALFILVAAFLLVIGALVIAVVYGQGGSRVFKRMQTTDTLLSDDDRFWKLGIFYFNPSDPSWFLPARFGIGWTCNFARPIVWLFTAGVVVLTILFMAAIIYIM